MRTDRGQSETLGAILLVAIMVIGVSVVAGALFAANSPTEHPNARIAATASESADGWVLIVEHRAGEPIPAEDFEIILREDGTTLAGSDGEPVTTNDRSDDDGVFEPSEVWTFEVDSTISNGDPVVLVYVGEERTLLDETTIDDAGENGGDGQGGDEQGGDGQGGDGQGGDGQGDGQDGDGEGEDGRERGCPWWWPPCFF